MEVQDKFQKNGDFKIVALVVSVDYKLPAKSFSYLKFKESAVASVNRSDRTILPVNMNEIHLVID